MISKFDTFYGGHVEMTSLGFDGPPVDGRSLSNEHLASVVDESLAFAELMDAAGYDTLWLGEHHFQREGYGGVSNLPLFSVYLAQHTERLHFGAFFNTLPVWHPLRIAEDYALADIMTGGRVRFGIGRGYIPREVETLGAPLLDAEANRDLFEEQLEIVLKAWTEPAFSHEGAHYTIPPRIPYRFGELSDITLVPRPVHGPLEIWQPITSGTQRGMDFMAKHGIKGVIAGGTAPGGQADHAAVLYREALARAGRETLLGEDLAIGVQIHIAETREQALREAALYYEEQLRVLAPLGRLPHLTAEQIRATADPAAAREAGLPTIEDADREGTWLCGSPEYVRDFILELGERFPGLERVFVQTGGLGLPPSVARADLEWFAQDVMPALQGAASARQP